jgi:hypothetical protein
VTREQISPVESFELVARDLISHFVTASPKEKRKTAQMKIFLYPSPLEKVPKGDEVTSHKFEL